MAIDRDGTTVLVGIDGSAGSQAAARWAIDQAGRWHAEVEVVYVWHLATMAYGAPGFVPPDRDEIERAGQRALEQVLAGVEVEPAAKLQLRVLEGRPADIVRTVAEEPQVGLVVVGRRGHGSITGMLLGSVSHELSHRCPKPLVIVNRSWERSPEAGGRVVVGVDGSAESSTALKWAATEAMARGACLEVVTAWTLTEVVGPREFDPGRSLESGLQAAAEEVAERAVAALELPGLDSRVVVTGGPPAAVLIDQAAGADLLVVGSRGIGRVREALFGSVGHACIHHSPVPVAIIPRTA